MSHGGMAELGCVGGLDLTPMASQLLVVSLRVSHNSSNVGDFGVSLWARCGTTRVITIAITAYNYRYTRLFFTEVGS